MSNINKIKSRLGTNACAGISREELGAIGVRTQGELRRGRSLKADHKRSIAKSGGYPDVISLRQHYDMAYRNGLGSNLAFGIVNDTWRVAPVIYDGVEDEGRRKNNPTDFERAVDEHFERLDVWLRLKALDRAQRPMRYGALQFVTTEDSGSTLEELIPLPTMDYLAKINVFHEAQLPVVEAGQNPASLDYGMPIIYDIRTNVAGSTNEWENSGYQVHASRVYAYGEGALDGSIYGVPCNEGCFEALMDLTKTRMSAAEGFFQNASNKYAVHLGEGSTPADADDIADEMDVLDNEMSRSMILGGGSLSMLQTQLNDPTSTWSIAANECAAHHSKPMSIIIGQMTGVLASEENIKSWNREIMDRQEGPGNEMIKGLINVFIERFNMPAPSDKINIVWRDLNESTAKQRVELSVQRATANKHCIDAGMQPIYSTEYMQAEAGAPIEEVIVLDNSGENDINNNLTGIEG